MAIKFMGREGYAETVEDHIELTNYLAYKLDQLSSFKRLGEVETAVCCFRFVPDCFADLDDEVLDRVQQRLQQTIERSGEVWLTTTIVHGRRALRANINSFLTKPYHVDDLIIALLKAAIEL